MDEKLFNVGLNIIEEKCQENDLQDIQIVLRQETELCLRSNSIFSFKKLCLNKILTENCSSLRNHYDLEPDPLAYQEMAHCTDLNLPINVQTIGPLFQVTPAQTKTKFV